MSRFLFLFESSSMLDSCCKRFNTQIQPFTLNTCVILCVVMVSSEQTIASINDLPNYVCCRSISLLFWVRFYQSGPCLFPLILFNASDILGWHQMLATPIHGWASRVTETLNIPHQIVIALSNYSTTLNLKGKWNKISSLKSFLT